jgi:diguanylate cyclase (GGDEF)-like protein
VARGCDEAKDVAAGLTEVLAGTSDLFVTTYACPFDGRYHWYQALISPIYRGELRKAMTMHVDVSALQRDPLTKLPNRALLDAQLGFAINAAKNNNTRLGVLLVDMNNLKLINDQFGHAVGDCAITSMARCLNKVFEPHGMVARIGGDEFGIVLGDTADDVSVRRLQNEFAACLNKQDCESAAPRMSAELWLFRLARRWCFAGSLVKGGRRTNVRQQAPASYSLAPSRLALGQRHPGLGEGGALPLRHVGKIGPRDGVLE